MWLKVKFDGTYEARWVRLSRTPCQCQSAGRQLIDDDANDSVTDRPYSNDTNIDRLVVRRNKKDDCRLTRHVPDVFISHADCNGINGVESIDRRHPAVVCKLYCHTSCMTYLHCICLERPGCIHGTTAS